MSIVTLQSEDHRRLLDIVDKLRSRGISKYVDLPEIVVCGDQSAGKSSVLEAISGMAFPTKDNLCTRFPTELILRRAASTDAKASIIPGLDKSASEKERIADVRLEAHDGGFDLGLLVEKAKVAMGISEGKPFSSDTFRIEISGPTQPHLTMVDLPGLFRAGNTTQASGDAPVVRELVRTYMSKPRSIILAVVSAQSDFALQEVTELARELDPHGVRTLGLITKPDTLYAGSDSEAAYLKLAQNKDVSFRLGWHVLRNRSYETRHFSSRERDADETAFFAAGVWTSMDPSCTGAESLKGRLSDVLKDQILDQLPSLLRDVAEGIRAGEARLSRLGGSRATPEAQRQYLARVAQDFSTLTKSATDGIYQESFFGSANTTDGYRRRLRAVVQNSLNDFQEAMRQEGEGRVILDEISADDATDSRVIHRNDFIIQVKRLMRRSRGRELPGTFNPLIIGDIFAEQCKPWEGLVARAKDGILEATYETVAAIVERVTIPETTDGILKTVHRRLDSMRTDLESETAELLQPYTTIHPITYNHYLIENVQKAQATRRRKGLERALKSLLDVHDLEASRSYYLNASSLLDLLDEQGEADMENYASNLAIDYMQAYYKVRWRQPELVMGDAADNFKVAAKRLIDDFSVLAVEKCLIGRLKYLLVPDQVLQMEQKEIEGLTRESEYAAVQREQCHEMLTVLREALRDLKSLDRHRVALRAKSMFPLTNNEGD